MSTQQSFISYWLRIKDLLQLQIEGTAGADAN
jgi:hypothetical protein